MKRNIGWALGLVILIVVALWFLQRPRPALPTGESKERTNASELSPQTAPDATAPDSTSKAAPKVVVPDVEVSSAQGTKNLKIRADQVLVKVNGVAITGKELMPFDPAKPDELKSLSPESYQYLLDRAIERELTFQEAKKEGVQLADSQQQQLDQLRETMKKEDAEAVKQGLVAHLSRGAPLEEMINFQVHDTTSAMLLNTLLANAGVPPQTVNSAVVTEYYKAHSDQYPPLPTNTNELAAAWNEIYNDISRQLARTILQEHLAGRAQYVEQLKSSAQIVTNQPPS